MVQSQTQQQQYLQVTNGVFGQGYHTMHWLLYFHLAPSVLKRRYLLLQALVLEHCSDLLVVLGLQPLPVQLAQWLQQALSSLDKRCHKIFSEMHN